MIRTKVDMRGFKRLADDLDKMAKQAIPHAIRNTLNGSAFELQRGWRGEVKRTFTVRNPFTERSIRVDKATGINVATMKAVTGSVADYMREQEEGATVTGPVPAPSAAGNPAGSKKRTRLTKAGYRFGAVQVGPHAAGYGRRRQNAVAIAVAMRTGNRFVLLNRRKGKGKGLFELKADGRRTRTHKVKMRMIWSVKMGAMKVKPEPTLGRTLASNRKAFERIQYDAMLNQLKRNKVFGYA